MKIWTIIIISFSYVDVLENSTFPLSVIDCNVKEISGLHLNEYETVVYIVGADGIVTSWNLFGFAKRLSADPKNGFDLSSNVYAFGGNDEILSLLPDGSVSVYNVSYYINTCNVLALLF